MQIRHRIARYAGFELYPYASLQPGESHHLYFKSMKEAGNEKQYEKKSL